MPPPPNSRALRTLLLQVRAPDDAMIAHEQACVRSRLHGRATDLRVRNALQEKAEPGWLDDVDALIIGGSGDFSVHDPRSGGWVAPLRHVLDRCLRDAIPGFGICFGHQLLGHHLGAQVITAEVHAELGTVDVQLTEHGRGDPLFADCEHEIPVHTGHSDCVMGVPDEVVLLASNEQLATQAFRVRDQCFYSTQFHPDLSGAEAASRYLAYRNSLDRKDPTAEDRAHRFRPGADASTVLLGQFVDVVLAHHDGE